MRLLGSELGVPEAFHAGIEVSVQECEALATAGIPDRMRDMKDFTAPRAAQNIDQTVDTGEATLQLRRSQAVPLVGALANYFRSMPSARVNESLVQLVVTCEVPGQWEKYRTLVTPLDAPNTQHAARAATDLERIMLLPNAIRRAR